MSRKDVILRILDQEDRPIRGVDLYNKLLKHPEGWKHGIVGGEAFWYADFPTLMNKLVNEGLVYKFRAGNKVFYYITEKGRSMVKPEDYQGVLRARLRYWVRRWLYLKSLESCLLDEEDVKKVEREIQSLVEKVENGQEYLKKRIVAEYAKRLVEETQFDWSARPKLPCPYEFVDKEYFDEHFKKVAKRLAKRRIRGLLELKKDRSYVWTDWQESQLKRLEELVKKLEGEK